MWTSRVVRRKLFFFFKRNSEVPFEVATSHVGDKFSRNTLSLNVLANMENYTWEKTNTLNTPFLRWNIMVVKYRDVLEENLSEVARDLGQECSFSIWMKRCSQKVWAYSGCMHKYAKLVVFLSVKKCFPSPLPVFITILCVELLNINNILENVWL